MAAILIPTRGYGNGTLVGTIPLVSLRGYASGAAASESARAYCVVARQTYTPGAQATQSFTAGAVREQTYHAGASATDNC